MTVSLATSTGKIDCRKKTLAAIRRGILMRPNKCQKCGLGNVVIEAHHQDYTKPLLVHWLCKTCHIKEDRSRRKIYPLDFDSSALVTLNLYLPSQEEKAEILAKAKERDKSVSEMVVSYFRKLPKKA